MVRASLSGWRAIRGSTWLLVCAWRCPSCVRGAAFSGPFAAEAPKGARLRAVSWNVAAVNQNPFEYWITHPSPAYKELMEGVETFINDPGEHDVRISELFTDDMFGFVMAKMKEVGIKELDAVQQMWESDYRSRKIVSGFLRDPVIGKKRLASMPDRITNTIQLHSGQNVFRPAVSNCFSGELPTVDAWFDQWLAFFFEHEVDVDGKGKRPVHSLLQKIKRSKYPAVSEEEERASVPLQLVLQGVFDAILVSLMQRLSGGTWQTLRREICESLNSRKNTKLLEILRTTYQVADVIFLQEAGNQLVQLLREDFKDDFLVVVPRDYSAKRNQNSVMLLRAGIFSHPEELQVPADGWEAGDLLVVKSTVAGKELVLASFHGDTNGLLTMPMLRRVMQHLPTERLLFGMDANTYERRSDSTAHVLEFERLYTELGLLACWGKVDPARYTTFNARTYLQPQLNKAARSTELAAKGDRNPKDFVLFSKDFALGRVWRDNTGRAEYVEDMVFPTLEFPSDHAAVAVDLVLLDEGTAKRTEL